MYEILVKPLTGMDDLRVTADSYEEFQDYVNVILDMVSNANSSLFMPEESSVRELVSCFSMVTNSTPPDFCPVIFDSVTCFNATPPGETQTSPCPRNALFRQKYRVASLDDNADRLNKQCH